MVGCIFILSGLMSGCGVWSIQPQSRSDFSQNYLKVFDHYQFQRHHNFTVSLGSKVMITQLDLMHAEEFTAANESGEENEDRHELNEQDQDEKKLLQMVQNIFRQAFIDTLVVEQQPDVQTSLITASKMGADYLFLMVPGDYYSGELLRSEDCKQKNHTFELPGGIQSQIEVKDCNWKMENPRDSAMLSFWVFAVSQKKLIDVAKLQTKSGLFTWFKDSPQGLVKQTLPKLLTTYTGQY